MSGMPLAGVQLVAQDYAPFMAVMQNATKAVEAFGAATTNSGKTAMPALADGAKSAASGLDGLNVQSLIGANVVGNLLTGAITTAWGQLTGFVNQMLSGVGAMQDLIINLETLAAREILYSGVTDDMSEALKMGASNAAGMFDELERLSIASPFRYEQVVGVFQMGMQFGQTSEMAMKLTGAITDLAAVNKGIPGIMQRLSYNFSQMSMTGKIMGRDIRDLAMAGLDLNKVLKLQLGKTVKEVNADLSSGKMAFEDVAQALVDYTDKYIGPAAKRASRTLGGLASTLADISFFTSKALLLPAAQRFTDALGGVLDKIVIFATSSDIERAGIVLDVFAEKLVNAAGLGEKEVATSFDQMRETVIEETGGWGDVLSDVAGEAFEWGVNVIAQLADGILEGVYNVLSFAMEAVAGMLSWWLSPGSPPRVAPNIDAWGASAINEYLKGFSEADFDLVDAISKPLKAALSLAADMGAIGEGDINAILSEIMRGAIAAAAGEGDFADVLAKIQATAGPFANEVANLAEKQFALAMATKEAEQWQNELNDAQQRAFTAGKAVSKGVQEYNDLLRKGASKEVLKAKLAEINASRQAQKIAVGEAQTAAEKVQGAQEGLGALKEQIGLQAKLVEQLTELARLQTLPAETVERGGGGGEPELPSGGGFPDIDTSEMFENMRLEIEKGINTAFSPITDVAKEWKRKFQQLEIDIGLMFAKLYLKALKNPVFLALVRGLIATVDALREGDWAAAWEAFSGSISNAWTLMQPGIEAIKTAIWDMIPEPIQTGFEVIGESISDAWSLISGSFSSAWDVIEPIWTDFINAITGPESTKRWQDGLTIVSTVITTIIGALLVGVGWMINYFSVIISTIVAVVTSVVAGVLSGITLMTDGFNLAWELIKEAWNGIASILSGEGGSIGDVIGNLLGGISVAIIAFFGGLLMAVATFVTSMWTMGTDIVAGLWGGIAEEWASFSEWVSGVWQGLVDWFKEIFGIESPSTVFSDLGTSIIEGLKNGIDTAWVTAKAAWEAIWESISTTVSTTVTEIKTTISTTTAEIKTAWDTFWTGLGTTVTTVWNTILTGIETAISGADGVLAKITNMVTSIGTAISNAYENLTLIGANIIKGMIDGITSTGQALLDAAVAVVKAAVTAVLAFLQEKSPSKLFMDIGENISLGMAEGVEQAANEPAQSANQMAAGTVKAVRPPSTSRVQPPATRAGVSVQIGDVYISDAQEGQMFEARVERAVMKALGAV